MQSDQKQSSLLQLDSKSIASANSVGISSGSTNGSGGQISYGNKDNVKVVIRGFIENGGVKKCVTIENSSTITIEQKPDFKVFNFDFVGDEDLEQEDLFTKVGKPIADCCLEGYNGSLFAYGQTGAGKTYTINGSFNGSEDNLSQYNDSDKNRGIMPRAFEYIFECIEKQKQKKESEKEGHFEHLVRCSYLEIYNEQIMDLLDPNQINMHIREDIKKGVYVEGLVEETVQNSSDMIDLIKRGAQNRHIGSTSMNKESSRSHSVLTTIIETKSMNEGGVWNIKTSRFHIIDLAGSERQKFTNAVGDRLKEAGMINKSLSALGNVINSLVDISEGKNRHVHYRDSKLTFLLRDSLGGNSKTVIIANISPSIQSYGETISTLKFAQRAKLIRNKAIINEDSSGTIQLLKSEIIRLKKDLAEQEKKSQNLGQQCAFCRNNIGNEITNNDNNEDDDNLLSESFQDHGDESDKKYFMSGPLNEALKIKFKTQRNDLSKMKERVVYLEGLLSSNLDNMTSQQKFYESEIQRLQQQNKKVQQAVESYEKQCSRDKMIIKFREDRIAKLESTGGAQTADDKQKLVDGLKKEIQIWKDASDHNAQAAKLYAEKAELQSKLDQQYKELKQTPDSLNAQMRSLGELNESLNDYLKQYCEESKRNVEEELAKSKLDYAEKIDALNAKITKLQRKEEKLTEKNKKEKEDLASQLDQYIKDIEKIRIDFNIEKDELEIQNKEKIQQIKIEIQQISKNKTEQERETQMLKLTLHESKNELDREKSRYNDKLHEMTQKDVFYQQEMEKKEQERVAVINEMKELEEVILQNQERFQNEIDQERKDYKQQQNIVNQEWERKFYEMEKQLINDQNERDITLEECDQLAQRIKTLEEENEFVQKTLIYKQEEIEDVSNQIKAKDTLIKDMEDKIIEFKSNFEMSNAEKQEWIDNIQKEIESIKQEKVELINQISQIESEKEQLNGMIQEINEEVSKLSLEKQQLQKMIEVNQTQINELQEQLDEKHQENQTLLFQISDLEGQISNINQQLLKTSTEKEEGIKLKQQDINQLEIQNKMLKADIQQIEEEKKCIQDKLKEFEQQNYKLEKQIQQEVESLKVEITQLESQKQQEIQQLQIQKEQEIKIFVTNYQMQITQIEQTQEQSKIQLEEQISVLQQQKEVQIEQLEEEFKVKLQQEQTDNESKLQDIIQNNEEQVKKIEEQNIQSIESMKTCYEIKLQELILQYQQFIEQLQLQINEQQNQLKHQKETHSSELKQIEAHYNSQVQDTSDSIHQQMQEQIEQVISQKDKVIIEQKHKEEQINRQLQSEIQQLQEALQNQGDQFQNNQQSQQQVISEKDNEIIYKNQMIQHIKQDYDQKITQLQSQLELLAQHKKGLDDQLKQLTQNYDTQQQNQEIIIKQIQQQKQIREEQLQQALQKKDEQIDHYVSQINNTQHDTNHLQQIYEQEKQLSKQLKEKLQEDKQRIASLDKDLEMQRKLLDNTLDQLNLEHIKKYQEIEKDHQQYIHQVKNECDSYKNQSRDYSQQISNLKERNTEMKQMLISSKETISGMVRKENELMIELEKKVNELKEHQDGWKKKLQDMGQERDQIKKEWERMKRENDNMRELIKLKDRQIEEQQNLDDKDNSVIEKMQKDNKDLRTQLVKRDFEMKEVVKTLKLFSEEKNRLSTELEKLHRENDQLVGHKNPNQKIQHHLKIKEENNKLREDNFKLQEELRRKTELLIKNGGKFSSQDQQQDEQFISSKDDMKKLKKENFNYQETINRLVDHILSQPGLIKILGLNDEMNDKIQQLTGSMKVKQAMDIISMFSNVIQTKEKDIKEIQRDRKKMECRLDILEKEKNLLKQQLEGYQISQGSFISQNNYQSKSPNTSHNRIVDNQMFYQMDPHLMNNYDGGFQNQNTSQSRLQVDGLMPNNINNMDIYNKKSPSPMYNVKLMKEKENVNSKRELFGSQRSGSARRTAFLTKQQ